MLDDQGFKSHKQWNWNDLEKLLHGPNPHKPQHHHLMERENKTKILMMKRL